MSQPMPEKLTGQCSMLEPEPMKEDRLSRTERLRRAGSGGSGVLHTLRSGLRGLLGVVLWCMACCFLLPAMILLATEVGHHQSGTIAGVLCLLTSLVLMAAGTYLIHPSCRPGRTQGRVIATAQEQQQMLNNAVPQPPVLGPLPTGYMHNLPSQQYPPAVYSPPLEADLPDEPPPAYEPPGHEHGALYQGVAGPHSGQYGSFQPPPSGPAQSLPHESLPAATSPNVAPPGDVISNPPRVPPSGVISNPTRVDV